MKLEDLENLEEYLRAITKLNINLKSKDKKSIVQAIVDKYALDYSTYENPEILLNLKYDLQKMIVELSKASGKKGTSMSAKAIDRFIGESQSKIKYTAEKQAVKTLSERQAQRRIGVYYAQLEKEVGILKADIEIFKLNSQIAGFSNKQILEQLIIGANEKKGMAQGFADRVKRVTAAATRREAQSKALDEYRMVAEPGELWEWITVSAKPCPDCEARAGKVLLLEDWEALGLPGEGRTICGSSCMCQLGPQSIFGEMFPDQKSFRFDLNETVLTTASELRKLNSKKAMGE